VRASEQQQETELELSARLLRSLAHRMRGDLSVVTNDLTYLSSILKPGEVDRSRARCATMVGVLSALSAFPTRSRRDRCALSELASKLLVQSVDPRVAGMCVYVDLSAIAYAAQLFERLLGGWSGGVSCITPDRSAMCELRFKEPRTFLQDYCSVGSMTAAELGESAVVEGCLLDLVLRDHGWRVSLSCLDSSVIARILLPIEEYEGVA
jgi:hypothetical protein